MTYRQEQKGRPGANGTASEEIDDEIDCNDPVQESNGFAAFRGRWIERGLSVHDLSDGAFRVLVGIAHFYLNRELRKAWPSAVQLGERIGMAPRTVEKHVAELRTKGLIRSVRVGFGRPNFIFPITEPQERAEQEPHVCADKPFETIL